MRTLAWFYLFVSTVSLIMAVNLARADDEDDETFFEEKTHHTIRVGAGAGINTLNDQTLPSGKIGAEVDGWDNEEGAGMMFGASFGTFGKEPIGSADFDFVFGNPLQPVRGQIDVSVDSTPLATRIRSYSGLQIVDRYNRFRVLLNPIGFHHDRSDGAEGGDSSIKIMLHRQLRPSLSLDVSAEGGLVWKIHTDPKTKITSVDGDVTTTPDQIISNTTVVTSLVEPGLKQTDIGLYGEGSLGLTWDIGHHAYVRAEGVAEGRNYKAVEIYLDDSRSKEQDHTDVNFNGMISAGMVLK